MIRQALWRSLASVFLGLGALGVILPGLPTTPFLLAAAWAGARGWPALEARLLDHPRYGGMIRDWREHRSVPRRAKGLACALMLTSLTIIWLSPVAVAVQLLVTATLASVALWLWTRPER